MIYYSIALIHNSLDLFKTTEFWAQTTVHAQNLLINDSGDGEAVETVSKGLPQLDVVPSLAFVIEAINSVDRGALVVASEEEEVLRVLDFVGQEQADGFK